MTTESIPDRNKFFKAALSSSLFDGRLDAPQIDGMNAILDACEEYGLWERDPLFPSYILATARGEVGAQMQPVREGFAETDGEARRHVYEMYKDGRISTDYASRHANGNSYYGRGFVQLTHGSNYKRMGQRLGLDLYKHPDLALNPEIAARILVIGCMEGLFTGRSLEDYLPEAPRQARKVVNAMDRADEFAGYAREFAAAISLARRDKQPQKVAERGFWSYLWKWIKQLIGG